VNESESRDPDRKALSLPGRPARVSRRGWFLFLSAAIILAILIAAREVLLPFILALVIAYVFTPGVVRIEKTGVPRWVAIVGIYAITLGTLYGFGALAAPRIAAEGKALVREVPKLLKRLQDEVIPVWEERLRGLSQTAEEAGPQPPPATSSSIKPPLLAPDEQKPALTVTPNADGYDVELGSGVELTPTDSGGWKVEAAEARKKGGMNRAVHYVQRNYVELVRGGVAVVSNVARGVFLFFMTLMLAAYVMLTHEAIIGFFRGMVRAPARPDFDHLLERMDRGLSGVVRGQLMICLVNGVLSAIGFALIGLKYWPVMALVAAVGSLIPIFGSILSSVPAVAIGLTQSPATALLVLGWILFIHQLEANFLNPKIIGDAAQLHPVLVVFVLLAGEHWFHAAGALLAVPCLSIAQSFFLHFREVADRDEVTGIGPPPPPEV
jgi:predicted PurR-regulated permease PerM